MYSSHLVQTFVKFSIRFEGCITELSSEEFGAVRHDNCNYAGVSISNITL